MGARVSIDILERRHSSTFLSEEEPRSWQPTEWTPSHITPIGKEVMVAAQDRQSLGVRVDSDLLGPRLQSLL